MIDVGLNDVPPTVATTASDALAYGWSVRLTVADGPPRTVALRISHADGRRAYGVWRIEDGTKWTGGASAGLQHLRTLAEFKAYIATEVA